MMGQRSDEEKRERREGKEKDINRVMGRLKIIK